MNDQIKYLIITDANYEIGSGHVMRQIALANHARAENIVSKRTEQGARVI